VLIEDKIECVSGLRRGFSRNYLPVRVAGAGDLSNQEVNLRIDGWQNGWLSADRHERGGAVSHPVALQPQ
jgi:hypothetical protein